MWLVPQPGSEAEKTSSLIQRLTPYRLFETIIGISITAVDSTICGHDSLSLLFILSFTGVLCFLSASNAYLHYHRMRKASRCRKRTSTSSVLYFNLPLFLLVAFIRIPIP
jgi:hypothetical protein